MMDLPGPQFVPRPGWGGQLRVWSARNGYRVVFSLIVLCLLAFIGQALWITLPTISPSPSPSPTDNTATLQPFELTAKPGDGMTNLAARAIDLYLALQPENIRLDAGQHLFAVDTLAHIVCWCPVELDSQITFDPLTISAIIDTAQNLSPAQRTAWSRLLR